MNLDLQLIRNKLLRLKKPLRNLLPLLRIAKDHQVEINHRMFFLQVHRIRKVNRKVNHQMINQVVRHHQIIRKQKVKHLHQQQLHPKNQLYHRRQFRRKLLNYLPLLLHLQQQKLILKKSQLILNQSHHQLMIINNQN
jgi:hypothetical protein